jgi:hypothetical protein
LSSCGGVFRPTGCGTYEVANYNVFTTKIVCHFVMRLLADVFRRMPSALPRAFICFMDIISFLSISPVLQSIGFSLNLNSQLSFHFYMHRSIQKKHIADA